MSYGNSHNTPNYTLAAMELVDSGHESHPEQPREALDSGTGNDLATDQILGTSESNVMTLDALSRRAAKRRTKTGCLTCRKRRIKCGEEKPICNNCIRSKRECEGYAQRLVFKRPVGLFGALGPSQQTNAPIQPAPVTMPFFGGYGHSISSQQEIPPGSRLPILAPRPTDLSAMGEDTFSTASDALHRGNQVENTTPFYYPAVNMRAPLPLTSETVGTGQEVLTDGPVYGHPRNPTTLDGNAHDTSLNSSFQSYDHTKNQSMPWGIPHAQHVTPEDAAYKAERSPVLGEQEQQVPFFRPEIPTSFGASDANLSYPASTWQSQSRQHEMHVPSQDAYDYDESEDYSDVVSDDEMLNQEQVEGFNQLSLIMASANRNERQLRSFTTHLNEPNILASYRPTFGSSPLNNPKTARIFAHFLHSTAPSLSIFERHPTDSSIILGAPVPTAQQGLWTYTLPLLALGDQALLQAVLAVSSLHISFLQRAPPTASLKHYHYALKRIGTAVSLPLRRKQIGTLAAILLLGYYEVIAAEYTKWTSHMGGSTQLVREIDFAGMTRDLRTHRRKVRAERDQISQSNLWLTDNYFSDNWILEDDPFAEKEGSIDEGLIGSIMGRVVNYDEFGQVDDGRARAPKKHFSRKDIENFRIQCDLYWWYTKQDIIQTLISGNKLFTPYYKWGQCPPRAGIGRLDAVYGSADHLWLLLARLADFAYRDRRRKLKAARSSGVEWRPSPELGKFMARFARGKQPQEQRHRTSFDPLGNKNSNGPHVQRHPRPGGEQTRPPPGNSDTSQHGIPSPQVDGRPMYGMIPPLGPIRLGTGFANSADHNDKMIDEDEEDDQGVTYKDAEREWESILTAFDTYTDALGRDYLPLPPDSTTPISTPFGPALQYRTNTIAAIWGYYYAARIMLYRFHPSMPPAMMVAAGVATPVTDEYAQIIGRIAGGIYYPQRYNFQAGRLNPNLGSSLVELTVPIYFSSVQYTDPAQRAWIVTQMREVSRLTGWESANVMIRGCESAWIVAAKQGRGPPYERIYHHDDQDTPFDTLKNREQGNIQQDGNTERRFVAISKSSRKHWAMGILSLEDDILNLAIGDR